MPRTDRITELHRNESSLVRELLELADRHRGVHEVHHVARDISRWSIEHVRLLADVAADHGEDLDPQALHLSDLQATIGRCHPSTLRQMRRAATSLKEQSTQILVS